MFEKYSEQARKAIFYARHEASEFSCGSLDTDHLLLGVLREDGKNIAKYIGDVAGYESIHEEMLQRVQQQEKIPIHVDMPFSEDCIRVLRYAEEEAELLRDDFIRPEHLLLGLMREDKFASAILLHQREVSASMLRAKLARPAQNSAEG